MAEYTNAEKADMILAYGATDCNGRAAQRLYAERHSVRRTPAHTMFARLHQQLCETGSFQKAARNRDRTARTELNEEIVLDMSLKECDFTPRQAFSQWYLQQRIENAFFAASVLFTDEASFSREGIFNTHNSHSWAAANPHVTRTRAAQDRFLVNVWAGILGDHLIGPYILPDRLTGPRYLIFLEHVLPELLDSAHVTAATRTSMWFQQDGASAHFSISVRNHLDATCGERWIGRGGPVHWSPRSPDLSCLDYFFWEQMKSLVYETPVNSAEELVARTSAAAGEIRNTPEMLSNVRRSMKRRCEACITCGGHVAREFDIAHSVVSRLWKSFKTTGMCSRRRAEGRVRSTMPAEDRYIVLSAKRNRRTTSQQVANQFLAASGKQISRKTVARRLRGGGLYARRPVGWACVLFSDESRFSLSSDCRCQLIWRESGTAYRPENIQEKDRYPTCSIMVWASIMINGRTRLHGVANGTMTGQRYIDEVLLPHVRLFCGAVGDKFVFMDDNATCHRTLAVQDCLDSEGIQRLVLPARSPDLNHIENVWDALERQVAGRNNPPTNKNTLIRSLTEEWDKLPQQLLDNVVQSMVRRVECCITLHGGHIPY
ncbi:transposable element Tc3 transposase [Trichonephila clavipes]|nr:transposable element Tc3 transposase [Trichonephila clavipes]